MAFPEERGKKFLQSLKAPQDAAAESNPPKVVTNNVTKERFSPGTRSTTGRIWKIFYLQPLDCRNKMYPSTASYTVD